MPVISLQNNKISSKTYISDIKLIPQISNQSRTKRRRKCHNVDESGKLWSLDGNFPQDLTPKHSDEKSCKTNAVSQKFVHTTTFY